MTLDIDLDSALDLPTLRAVLRLLLDEWMSERGIVPARALVVEGRYGDDETSDNMDLVTQ
jgi:hypothetical protein